MSCGAPEQTATLPTSVDLAKETVISGTVTADGVPVPGAYVRLLDNSGEFTAEVVASDDGAFRFFAAPGSWTVRALSRRGNGDASVAAATGLTEVAIPVTR